MNFSLNNWLWKSSCKQIVYHNFNMFQNYVICTKKKKNLKSINKSPVFLPFIIDLSAKQHFNSTFFPWSLYWMTKTWDFFQFDRKLWKFDYGFRALFLTYSSFTKISIFGRLLSLLSSFYQSICIKDWEGKYHKQNRELLFLSFSIWIEEVKGLQKIPIH